MNRLRLMTALLLLAIASAVHAAAPPDSVRDNFNRSDGAIGASWTGNVANVGIVGGRLKVLTLAAGANPWISWAAATQLDPMQYVHMTIGSPPGIQWQCLTLRGQPSTDSRIQVSFKPSTIVMQTRTDGVWQAPIASAAVSVAAGDKVAAKVDSFGTVTVYKNGATALTGSFASWKYAASRGAPGIAGAVGMICDDFGFGAASAAVPPPPPPPVNHSPTSLISGSLTASFSGAASSDPDGDALTYAWDFGDGATGVGVSVTHVYPTSGTYTVSLTVSDGRGGSATSNVSMTVSLPNEPPPPPPPPPTSIRFSFHAPTMNSDNCAGGVAASDSVMSHWRVTPLGIQDSTLSIRGNLISPAYTSPNAQQVIAWPSRWGYANGGRYYARGCDSQPLTVAPK